MSTIPISTDPAALQAEAAQFKQEFANAREAIGRVIVGQQRVVEAALTAIFCGGNVLLEGVPGLGKTELVKALSRVLDLEFRRIQFTPDLMPSDILGTEVIEDDAAGKRHVRFIPGPVFANIILADEINRTPPRTQAA
ncbi:MAG: AAA family ATPase, partial [Planctomycetota bacterium]|nr:AAA family ATPase [Planctomycetota bacterium]